MSIPYNPLLKPPLGTPINKARAKQLGLVGYWLMNEGGGSKVYDLSGNRNNGSLIADTHFVPGKFGSALDFNGTGDYVDCGTGTGNLLGSANKNVSVSLWFNINASWVNDGHFSIGPLGAVSGKLDILQINNNLSFRMNATNFNQSFGFTDIASWHHLVAAYDGVRGKLYIDGVEKINAAYSTAVDFTDLNTYIGIYYSAAQSWGGQLDNVLICNRAPTASEIALLYREPFYLFGREPIELWTGEAGVAGAMTLNTGYWGMTI